MSKKKSNAKSLAYRIKKFFEYNPLHGFTYRQVQKKIGKKYSKNEIIREIEIMIEQKVLSKGKDGKIYSIKTADLKKKATSNGKLVEGTVDLTARGSAYIVVPNEDNDIFISSRNVNRAFDGDKVKVQIKGVSRRGKVEGEIVEITERAQEQYVCTISKSKDYAFCLPENNKIPVDFYIKNKNLGDAQDGDRVVVEMNGWPEDQKNPYGLVKKVLGKPGENEVEMLSILVENGFKLKFPKKVLKFINDLPVEIPASEIKKRRDFRKKTTFTIDPHDAKDFDDALSLEKLENGNYEIGVHIADISHYVPVGSVADIEARYRATSVYLVDRVIPMFPEKLSNEICSLRPNEDKLCFSAIFEMNEKGKVLKKDFARTVIHSDRRFTYEEAQKVIETGEGDMKEEILTLHNIATKLRAERVKKGSIKFDRPEVRFRLDDDGKPIEIYQKIQKEANHLIEDFMLLANKAVATYFAGYVLKGQKPPGVYRVHDQPEEEKLSNLRSMAAKFGYKGDFSSPQSTAQSINRILEASRNKPESNLLDVLAIRSMSKAVYTTENIGHYGLAFDNYTHFTSPIRRYPDVMVHRILQDFLDKKPVWQKDELKEICKHSSSMEKNAQGAERESTKLKQVEYLSERVGQEFEGVISGVQAYGFFVEMNENYCEGLVRTETLLDDKYLYLDDEMKLVGYRTKKSFRLGDKVKVLVAATDLKLRQVDLELITTK